MLDTALRALTDPFSLRYRSFGPRRRPRPRPMRDARRPRSRSRWVCLALGSWLAVAAAAAVSCVLCSVYLTSSHLPACVFVFCLLRHSLPPACVLCLVRFTGPPRQKNAALPTGAFCEVHSRVLAMAGVDKPIGAQCSCLFSGGPSGTSTPKQSPPAAAFLAKNGLCSAVFPGSGRGYRSSNPAVKGQADVAQNQQTRVIRMTCL
jgi:hypothetical protein